MAFFVASTAEDMFAECMRGLGWEDSDRDGRRKRRLRSRGDEEVKRFSVVESLLIVCKRVKMA